MILPIYKSFGETPLQTIQKLRKLRPEFKDGVISYAGRLDPMAEGLILLVIGEENKERAKYLNLSKVYTFQAILGIETDTFDLLGLVNTNKKQSLCHQENIKQKIEKFIKQYLGKQNQSYPPFSSKTVAGKSLFTWAKEGRLNEILIPSHQIEIFSFEFDGITTIAKEEIQTRIENALQIVSGDFRQHNIAEYWSKYFTSNRTKSYPLISCTIHCSSGTYIRQIIHELGEYLGCGAVAYEIKRVQVGDYTIENSCHYECK